MNLTSGKLICLGVSTVIVLIIGIGGPFLIDSVIKSQVNDQVMMTDKNFDLWGVIPGESGVDVVRDVYFYNFTNSRDVIFKNAKPEFHEIGPFQYYENHDFTAPEYEQDGKEVSFYFKQWFTPGKGTDGETKMQAINLGPMGAWMQMKSANISQIASQAMGTLITSLQEQIVPSVIGTGITANLFDTIENTEKILKKKCNLSDLQARAVASDPNYGLNNNTVFPWTILSYEIDSDKNIKEREDGSGTFTFLQNYFGLSYSQMSSIKNLIYNGDGLVNIGADRTYRWLIQGKFQGILENAAKLAIHNPFCIKYKKLINDSKNNVKCDANFLAALQWTIQGVTENPPTITGVDDIHIPSIAYVNHTLIGYPEIRYYFDEGFSNKDSEFYVSDAQNFKDQFDDSQNDNWIIWGIQAMKTNMETPKSYVKNNYPHAWLNIGNMRTITLLGNQYDEETKMQYKPTNKVLKQLQAKLALDTPEKTYIIWNYIKYMVNYFAEMKNKGGNSGTAALGQVVAAGLSTNVNKMSDFLLPNLLSELLANAFKTTKCDNLMFQGQITDAQANRACSDYFQVQGGFMNQAQFLSLLDLCTQQTNKQVNEFKTATDIDINVLVDFCTKDTDFSKQLTAFQKEFADGYQCFNEDYCTQFEIAVKQWQSSQITNEPIKSVKELPNYKQSLTITDWYPKEFKTPFEFGWFKKDFEDVLTKDGKEKDIFEPDYDQSYSLLSYDKMYSGTLMNLALIEAYDGEDQAVKEIYEWDNSYQFLTYARYIGLYAGFGGFMQERSVYSLLTGYTDPFLKDLSELNPQLGGDPSIMTEVILMDPDINTDEKAIQPEWKWTMTTGKGDIQKVRMYTAIADHDYTVLVQHGFDGENIYVDYFNPYAAEVPVYGNDGTAANPEQQEGQTNPVYIYNLYAGKNLKQTGTRKRNGLDCYTYQPQPKDFYNAESNPDNAVYYNNGANGVFNMSGNQGAPIFNSQTHFYQGDQQLNENITVYNTEGNLQGPSKYDETYIDSEIYTGTTLSVVLNLQINYAMEPDILFPQDYTRYLPIYYMYRASNWTDSQANAQFGPLSMGLDLKLGILIGFTSLGGIMLIALIYLIVRYRKKIKEQELSDDEEESGEIKQKLLGKDKSQNNKINNNFSTKITDN